MPAITLLQPFNLDSTKDYSFSNVTANIKTDNLMYANGSPYVLGGTVSGSNTQVQFNNANSFGSSANFTFDLSTNSLSVTNIIANGAGLTSLTGANVTGFVPNANVANTAYSVSGGNVSGQVGNALVAGTVYTNAQPNITSVGTLTGLTVSGALAAGDATITGNLIVNGTTVTANVATINVKDPIIEQGGEVSGPLTTNDGKDRGTVLHYYSGGVVDAFMGWDNSNAEFAFGSNVTVSSEVVTFNTLGNLRAGVYFGNGAGLTNLAGANVTGFVPNANVSNTAYSVSGANVSGDVSGANHANVADLANSVAGSNVTGQVGNALVAGTVYTNSQPNITSVGTLTSLTVSGATDLGAVANVKITGGTANYILKTDGAGNLSWTEMSTGTGNANVAGSNTQIQFNNGTNLGASANLTFDATTKTLTVDNLVANGAGLTFITGSNVSGFVPNANVANTAYSVSGANVSGDVSGANHANVADVANSVAGANVTGTVANATFATTAGTAYSVSGSNVSGAVAYATTANSVAGANVSGQVGNALVAGTVYTNAQPNITSVGTLSSLDITGNVTAGNANLGNLTTANFFTGNGSLLTSITGANVTGTVANATYATSAASATTAGTVTTNAQPNITSVGTLSSLSVTGNVTAGNLISNATISGVDATFSGNLTILGTTTTVNSTTTTVVDPIFELGGGPNATALTSNDSKDRGHVLHYYSGSPVDAFMGWDNSNAEFAFGSNVSVSSDIVTFNSLGNVRANHFIGNGSALTGISAVTAISLVYGTSNVVVAENSNVTIGIGGNANVVTITGTGANITGYANVTGNLTVGNVFANAGTVVANLVTGTLTTASQPNITSVGSLTGLTVTGNAAFSGANVSLGSVSNLKIDGGTANYVLKTDGTGNLNWVAQTQVANITVDNFTGNGVQTTFTLSTTPSNVNTVLVNLNGATQLREAYSLSGADIIFGSAPPNTAKIEITTLGLTAQGASGFTYNSVTANASATARNRYIVNTDTTAITITLPSSPSFGDEIGIIDGTGNAASNTITIARNGQKINGATSNYTITTNRGSLSLVYYDSNQGWLAI